MTGMTTPCAAASSHETRRMRQIAKGGVHISGELAAHADCDAFLQHNDIPGACERIA